MSDKRVFRLVHSEARQRALEAVKEAPAGFVVEVKPPTRSLEANARLHAMLSDIAEQKEWAGRKWDTETWKRLLVAAWMRARNEHVEMIPALDGKGFDVLFHRTSKMSKAEVSELMTYIEAWGAENDIQWRQV